MGSQDEQRPSLEIGFGRAKPARVSAPREEPARSRTTTSAAGDPPPAKADRSAKRPRSERAAREAKASRERPVRDPRPPRAPYGLVTTCVLTGLLVGLALVGAGAGALRGCAAVRGTSSCGAAGLPILAVILAAGVMLGMVALRWLAHTPSAPSISFLAVAFVALVSSLFLLDALDGPAALVIVPALSILGFLGAHLVTSRYIDS